MWQDLDKKERDRYEKLIKNFASLSEAFAQKEEDGDSIVAPIVNSKFQETAFQKCFNAYAEDIANTSYDASIDNGKRKYLVGIKTFGIKAGDQKIAQFKSIAGSSEWAELINEMKQNAVGLKDKDEINKVNQDLYLELAKKIATARNERIESSKANLNGFKLKPKKKKSNDNLEVNDTTVEAVYHVLMPSSKNETPEISVGETRYDPIDIDNIKIEGCTTLKKPQNFTFRDETHDHEYKWTAADSQLSMKFNNKDIVLEKWPVHYVKDAFSFFENMGQKAEKKPESYSWMIDIQPYSGFNAFMGQSKLKRKDFYREYRIIKLKKEYANKLKPDQLDTLIAYLSKLLLINWKTDEAKLEMIQIRQELIDFIKKITNSNNSELLNKVRKMVYRPSNEFELRIPNSREFHFEHPSFFINHPILKVGSSKCIGTKEKRSFNLRFLPSNKQTTAYINQSDGKAIESLGKQTNLGEWILRGVFQMPPYEPVTQEKLDEIGINAVRLTKHADAIDMEFIWIEKDDKPEDFWE